MNWRSIHKWLSVLIGVQVLVWVLSGLVISLLDHDLVDARTSFVAIRWQYTD